MSYDAPVEDVYAPDKPLLAAGTPSGLDEVLREAMRQYGINLKVCLPASVSVVSGVQQVDVQPSIQVRYAGQADPVDMPVIQNVPVLMPMGQNYAVKLPIAEGDQGLLLFSDRSLDVWSSGTPGDQTVDCGDTRTHHISDAIFVPGLVPFAGQLIDSTDDLVVKAGTASLRVQQEGTFFMGANGQEMLDLVGQLTQSVSSLIELLGSAETLTMTMLGPQPFLASTQALLAQQKEVVDQITENLQSITGEAP